MNLSKQRPWLSLGIILGAVLYMAPELVAQQAIPIDSGYRADPLWVQHYESRRFLSKALSADEQGNLYSGGTFETYFLGSDTGYVMPPLSHRESFANYPWLQKHDLEGNLAWTVYAMGQARLHAVDNDEKGHVYITGEVWSPALVFVSADGQQDSLDKSPSSNRGAYVAKFNAKGQLLKSFYFSLDRFDNFNCLAIDSKGHLLLGGTYNYRKGSELIRSFQLVKMNAELEPIWLIDGDTIGRSQISCITVDGSDNIYLGGGYTEDLKIGSARLSTDHQTQKGFVAKISKEGKLKWLQGALTDPDEMHTQVVVGGIVVDFWRRVYLCGSRFGRLYLAKLDRGGELEWMTGRQARNRSNYPFGMSFNEKGNLMVYGHGYGGRLFSTVGGDSVDYTAMGSTDFWLGEYDRQGRIQKFQFGGGRGTDYASGLVYRKGKVYLLGHDLGGPPVRFDQRRILLKERIGYLRRSPVMWLACFDWD